MRKLVALSFLFFGLAGLAVYTTEAQTQKKDTPPSVKLDIKGGARTIASDKLHKFEQPRSTIPDKRPPERKDGRWHWHPHHGWVLLPLTLSPRTVLLPPTFVLPPQVTYYEIPASSPVLLCPHCGKPITIQID